MDKLYEIEQWNKKVKGGMAVDPYVAAGYVDYLLQFAQNVCEAEDNEDDEFDIDCCYCDPDCHCDHCCECDCRH